MPNSTLAHRFRACAAALMVVTAPPAAFAQTDNRFAVGAEITHRVSRDRDGHDSTEVGATWRLGHSETGWGWGYGLGWFSTDLDRTIGGGRVEFGELKIRPFLAGYGYTRALGKFAVSGELLGGLGWTSFELSPHAVDAYVDRLGARSISATVGNTFVVRPEAGVWYDLNQKIGIRFSLAYVLARPEITVRSTLGDAAFRYRADMVRFNVGAVYSIF